MRKLTISRTTLRHLTTEQLGRARGAGDASGTATQLGCNSQDCSATTIPQPTQGCTTVGHG